MILVVLVAVIIGQAIGLTLVLRLFARSWGDETIAIGLFAFALLMVPFLAVLGQLRDNEAQHQQVPLPLKTLGAGVIAGTCGGLLALYVGDHGAAPVIFTGLALQAALLWRVRKILHATHR
jgi:hypothetical protein